MAGRASTNLNNAGVVIASKPFVYENRIHLLVHWASATQPMLFLVGIQEVGGSEYFDVYGAILRYDNQSTHNYIPRINPHVLTLDTGVYSALVGRQEFNAGNNKIYHSYYECRMDFTFRIAKSEVGELISFGGACGRFYDGAQTFAPPLLYPEDLKVVEGSGGSIADGTYSYKVVYEYSDRRGNRWKSAPSEGVSITVSSGPSKVTVSAAYLGMVDYNIGSDVKIHVYRTLAGGSKYYFTGFTIDNVITGTTVGSVDDTFADATIETNQLLYTTGGELETAVLPSYCAIAQVAGRMYTVPCEDRKSVWYSKKKTQTLGYEHSTALSVRIEGGGAITALAPLDDRLVIFKRDEIYLLEGTGPNSLGQGAFRPPIKVSSDTGAIDQRGVVSTADGVMFKSDKGIYLLDRGLRTTYIGAPVADFDSIDVTSAVFHSDKNQVMFAIDQAASSYLDRILVYDTLVRQWSTYAMLLEIEDMTIWGGRHTICGNNTLADNPAIIATYDTAVVRDFGVDDYNFLVKLGWLQPFGQLGWGRIKEIFVFGEISDAPAGHSLRLILTYDYYPTSSETITISDFSATDDLAFLAPKPARQKCSSVQVQIDESHTNKAITTVKFRGLAFKVQKKEGMQKRSLYAIT
jgi:hypothetical protein